MGLSDGLLATSGNCILFTLQLEHITAVQYLLECPALRGISWTFKQLLTDCSAASLAASMDVHAIQQTKPP